VKRFARFWIDFLIGDDWRIAAGVVLAVLETALLSHAGLEAWWLMPLATAAILFTATTRRSRKR
jgi:hypothetical protein